MFWRARDFSCCCSSSTTLRSLRLAPYAKWKSAGSRTNDELGRQKAQVRFFVGIECGHQDPEVGEMRAKGEVKNMDPPFSSISFFQLTLLLVQNRRERRCEEDTRRHTLKIHAHAEQMGKKKERDVVLVFFFFSRFLHLVPSPTAQRPSRP